MAEAVEIESGKKNDRPRLIEALRLCRLHNAILIIAKLDRLSRDAHFLLGLEKAGVEFVAADMPSANRLTAGIMAMVADEERRMISRRTKDALAAAKARGRRSEATGATCRLLAIRAGPSASRHARPRPGAAQQTLFRSSRSCGPPVLSPSSRSWRS
jgi:DNA invertase Pin-like site-specific DNA recombinase